MATRTFPINRLPAVRCDDLLNSTPRQIILYHALGMAHRIPNYTHVPLDISFDDKRLDKRHRSTRINESGETGFDSICLVARLAKCFGVSDIGELIGVHKLIFGFSLNDLQVDLIVFDTSNFLQGCA